MQFVNEPPLCYRTLIQRDLKRRIHRGDEKTPSRNEKGSAEQTDSLSSSRILPELAPGLEVRVWMLHMEIGTSPSNF